MKRYEEVEITVEFFEIEDVITSSPVDGTTADSELPGA